MKKCIYNNFIDDSYKKNVNRVNKIIVQGDEPEIKNLRDIFPNGVSMKLRVVPRKISNEVFALVNRNFESNKISLYGLNQINDGGMYGYESVELFHVNEVLVLDDSWDKKINVSVFDEDCIFAKLFRFAKNDEKFSFKPTENGEYSDPPGEYDCIVWSYYGGGFAQHENVVNIKQYYYHVDEKNDIKIDLIPKNGFEQEKNVLYDFSCSKLVFGEVANTSLSDDINCGGVRTKLKIGKLVCAYKSFSYYSTGNDFFVNFNKLQEGE